MTGSALTASRCTREARPRRRRRHRSHHHSDACSRDAGTSTGGESLSVSVELYPDAAFSALVTQVRRAAIGFTSNEQPQADWRPHLTLLIADELDLRRGAEVVRAISGEITSIPVMFSRLDCFGSNPDHVFLAPNPNPELDRAHR